MSRLIALAALDEIVSSSNEPAIIRKAHEARKLICVYEALADLEKILKEIEISEKKDVKALVAEARKVIKKIR